MQRNNNKENITLLLLIILILVIPLFFISLEMLQNLKIISGINPSEVISTTLDDLYNNIKAMPKNNDASNIRKCLVEIFDLMNKKEFNKLYSLLTDDMKKSMFLSEEDFSDYMMTYLGDETYSPNFTKYTKLNNEENDVFILKVNFLPYSTSEEDILSEPEILKIDTFTLYIYDDLTYKFSFLKYIGTGRADNAVFENDIFSCRLLSTDLYINQTTFNIEVTNKIDNDIFINDEEIYVTTGLMPKYYTSSTLIPSHTSTNIQFTVYTGLNLKECLPFDIYFRGIHTNGKVYLFKLPIKYPVKVSNIRN